MANDVAADMQPADLKRLLPTEHELSRVERAQLEAVRLDCLGTALQSLFQDAREQLPAQSITELKNDLAKGPGDAPPQPKEGSPGSQNPTAVTWQTIHDELQGLHLELLDWLACIGRPIVLAYELGRSLHDTVTSPYQALLVDRAQSDQQKPSTTIDALTSALGRDRIATLQEWLGTLAPHLPTDSSSVVKASLGRWSDYVTAGLVDGYPGKAKGGAAGKKQFAEHSTEALLRQGDVWLNLLVGTQSLNGILTPEAYVAAGEQALSRSARIIRRVVVHYWPAIFIVVLAAAGLTALSGVYLGGAGKVWTQIATIGSALGITAKGIGSRIAKLADAGEKPIYRAAEVDAMAWAVTTLPKARLSIRGVRALRRSGVQGQAPLGRA
jgi:hypothetical protein